MNVNNVSGEVINLPTVNTQQLEPKLTLILISVVSVTLTSRFFSFSPLGPRFSAKQPFFDRSISFFGCHDVKWP